MNRRQAIRQSLLLLGGAAYISSAGLLYQSCTTNKEKKNGLDLSLIDEVCDTIIPDTKVPGAKAAGVGTYIILMLKDCYPEETRKLIQEGLDLIQQKTKTRNNVVFQKASYNQRQDILKSIEKEGLEFFKILKGLINKGYYTSEIGCTKALAFDFIPGKYDPCLIIASTQRAWAM